VNHVVFYIKCGKLYAIIINEREKRVRIYDMDEKKLVEDRVFSRVATRRGLVDSALKILS
jgi:hypothetical protein